MSSNPLFDKQGNRLYMNAEERKKFLGGGQTKTQSESA